MTIRWNRAGEDRDGRDRRPVAARSSRARWSRWIDLDFRVNFLVRVHGMAQLLLMNADNELQLYISPVNWKPDNAAGADVVAGVVLRRPLRAPRLLPHARLGRSDVAAQRRPHGRADVHGRSLPGVRRSRAGDPEPHRRAQLGSARRRHRVDRSRAAHDVAAHRSEASDVRRGARREVRRLDRARLPARRSSSSAKCSSASSRARRC